MTTTPATAPVSRQGVPDSKPCGDHSEYFAMVTRVLRAAGRRAGSADPEDVAELVRLHDDLTASVAHAVHGLRSAGFSWAEIAAPLGITRQSAQERWGAR